ncbi:nucleotidyltransferase family protein [Methanomethylovorans sp.]|uniref:nucleotidyltransferase family protein n=1 Tax=Methanomethylovorans sp. TaxID=2758717 RepID=UPI00351CA907
MNEAQGRCVKMDNIKLLIKEHGSEIRKMFKAEVIGIFGSYARGEEKAGSDVDVLVNFMMVQLFLIWWDLETTLKRCLAFLLMWFPCGPCIQ